MENNDTKQCQICKKPGGLFCSNCGGVSYCGKEHQKKDWSEHKLVCKPFKICFNEIFGRYIVASRNIKPGEVIIKDKPVVLGPSVESAPICLGCYRVLPEESLYSCSRCKKAPMCGIGCESQGGHNLEECRAFAKSSNLTRHNLTENQQIILPLRCLLAKHNNEIWTRILQLESHVNKRINTPIWKSHQRNVVEVLKNSGILNTSDISEDLIQQINGILDVNTFEVRIPGLGQFTNHIAAESDCIRGLYLDASLMAHDCIGNTHIAVDDTFNMIIHASVPINKGNPIYFNYTNPLQGTAERQEHLQIGKYFECSCQRCADPTEMETFMSSIKCPRCRKGFICPPVGQANHRFRPTTIWKCIQCQHAYRGCLVNTTTQLVKDILDNADKTDTKVMERILKQLLRTLPVGHSLIIDLKQCLIGAYRNILRTDPNPGRKILTRKLELCRELLPLLEKIEPGISRLRGITLYEMHIPIVVLSNRDYENHSISAHDLLARLEEANDAARTAIKFLLYEPPASPEGRLAKRALEELRMLANSIENVRQIVEVEKTRKKKSRRRK